MLRGSPETDFPPGAYLRELLIWRHIGFGEFFELSGIPKTEITEIVEKRRGIDKTVSDGLAAYFGNSSRFWLTLQKISTTGIEGLVKCYKQESLFSGELCQH